MDKTNNESKSVDNQGQDQDNDKHFSKIIKNKSNEEDAKKTKQAKNKEQSIRTRDGPRCCRSK